MVVHGAASVRRGAGAAYRQISRELQRRIAEGEFDLDRKLPTEDELMVAYGVSRHTVRAALSMLVADGLVERFAGRGTYLSERRAEQGSWRIRSLDDIVNESFPADPEVLDVSVLSDRSDREAARALDLDPGAKMMRITAVRRGEGGPLACSQILVPVEIGRCIAPDIATQLGRQPVVRLIERRLGLRAARVVQVATMRRPPPIIARALDEPPDQMTITLLRTYTTRDGQPFEFSRLFGKPGRFQNVIEFASQEGFDGA
jgi:GntR family transcriptional regulator